MRMAEDICYSLSKIMRKVDLLDQFYRNTYISEDIYFDTIYGDAARSYQVFDSLISFKNKSVLDVGCGVGARTSYYAQQALQHITGTDINHEMLIKAKRLIREKKIANAHKISYQPCEPGRLPFDDDQFDIVIMDCVFEHLSDPGSVLKECMRVLKPGGFACIDFQPWLNPHGAHVDNLIPIPWNHVFFSQKTLINVAARLYDRDDYRTGFWDFCEETGKKKKNKWRHLDQLPELNFMTIEKFNRIIHTGRFPVYHYSLRSYEDIDRRWVRTIAAAMRGLLMNTRLREYFTRYVICVLQKETGAGD